MTNTRKNCYWQMSEILKMVNTSETNGEEANPGESHDDDVSKGEASQGSSSRSSDGASNRKRKYVPTPASRKKI